MLERMKKGQTAMEYLMTYGWAILIVVVVGAVLWQQGFLDPGEMVPEQGCPNEQIAVASAADWSLDSAGSFQAIIENRAIPDGVNVTGVTVEVDGDEESSEEGLMLSQGQSDEVNVNGLSVGETGSSIEPTLTITYDVQDGLTDQTVTCELSGEVA